jgi:cysteinyl-tRNA synthetase
MPLKIYNTLSRRKEEFKPVQEGHVGIYVCGPTVYSDSHVGHAKSYVSFDVIVRYLRYIGYKVLYVQNITDVGHLLDDGEDRMLRQSKIEKIHPMQIAERITRSYFEDMDKLAVVRPDISPRASGHITEQIEMVKQLLSKGFAYEVNGSVYFDIKKFGDYGKLSGRTLEESVEGTRVEARSEKRSSADFALWKKAERGHIMRWPSPWGEGFPGWHIECSAMSMKYIGETLDIHGGGMDNQFPHHECEIAQSEAATGKPFVKYWVHNNLVTVNGQKMSKSLGNFVVLKEVFNKYDPLVLRFFILQGHYRSTMDFSIEAVESAKSGYEKIINTLRHLGEEIHRAEREERRGGKSLDLSTYREKILEAMNDDFNTPVALGVLLDICRELNQSFNSDSKMDAVSLKETDNLFREFGRDVLGILPDAPAVQIGDAKTESALMELVMEVRTEARKQKLWNLSDLIRDRLKSAGFSIEDKKDGTGWRKGN